MELEEIQSVWQDMSQKLEKQHQLTDKLIIEMTRKKYANKFNKLILYEGTGSVVCILMAGVLLYFFGRLDTWYQQVSGVLAFLFLTVYPYLTLNAIYNMKKINISRGSLKDTLTAFEKAKQKMLLIQRTGIGMSVVFTFLSLIIADKLINNRDIISDEYAYKFWFLIPIILFLLYFCRWGYRMYVKTTDSAESILRDLEED